MRRITVNLPDDLHAELRHEPRLGSTIGDVTRPANEAHVGGVAGRRLIAAKAGRSGSRDTARCIEDHPAAGRAITLIVDAGPLYSHIDDHEASSVNDLSPNKKVTNSGCSGDGWDGTGRPFRKVAKVGDDSIWSARGKATAF